MAKNTNKNAFTLRLTNRGTLATFNELLATKIFESKNVLANKIISHGIKHFADMYLRKDVKMSLQETKPENREKEIKQIRNTTEDTFIIMTTMERLLSALYNVKVSELQGDKVSADEMTSGIMAELPPEFQVIKNEVVRLRAGRLKK